MDPKVRRQVLRMIPHGLQVVTLRSGEEVHGYTSSWLTQVSFEPPLLVLGVRRDSRALSMMEASGVLCVHFLKKEQQDVAQDFFRPSQFTGDKFVGLDHEPGVRTGCPVLRDALAHAECRVVQIVAAGDHSVVIARVLDAEVHHEGEPLHLSDTPWQYGG